MEVCKISIPLFICNIIEGWKTPGLKEAFSLVTCARKMCKAVISYNVPQEPEYTEIYNLTTQRRGGLDFGAGYHWEVVTLVNGERRSGHF